MAEPHVHPLCWPPGFPRSGTQEAGQFKTDREKALQNVIGSLRRFGADSGKKVESTILSSNVTLLDDSPDDPGVAVWFRWDGIQVCIPCDRYKTVAANLQAVHHIIEARRVELRHGTLALVRATFNGFKAIAPPRGGTWREVLGIPTTARVDKGVIERAYIGQAKKRHPDAGGTAHQMAELNNARDTAMAELGL